MKPGCGAGGVGCSLRGLQQAGKGLFTSMHCQSSSGSGMDCGLLQSWGCIGPVIGPWAIMFLEEGTWTAKGLNCRSHLGNKVVCGSDEGNDEFVVQG